jgi:hypothetical protein
MRTLVALCVLVFCDLLKVPGGASKLDATVFAA